MNGRLATARRLSAPFILLVAFILLPAEARAASVVNARTYGMVNGNKTDNSAALLRACQAGVRKGLPVLIPKGRYYLASPVHLPAGVKLRGAGGHTSAANAHTHHREHCHPVLHHRYTSTRSARSS